MGRKMSGNRLSALQKTKNAIRARKSQYRKHDREMRLSRSPTMKEVQCRDERELHLFNTFISEEGLIWVKTVMYGSGEGGITDEVVDSEDGRKVGGLIKAGGHPWEKLSPEFVEFIRLTFPGHANTELEGELPEHTTVENQSTEEEFLSYMNGICHTAHIFDVPTSPDVPQEFLDAIKHLAGPCSPDVDLFERARLLADIAKSFGLDPVIHIFDSPPGPGDIPARAITFGNASGV